MEYIFFLILKLESLITVFLIDSILSILALLSYKWNHSYCNSIKDPLVQCFLLHVQTFISFLADFQYNKPSIFNKEIIILEISQILPESSNLWHKTEILNFTNFFSKFWNCEVGNFM